MTTIHEVRPCSLVSLSAALYRELQDRGIHMPHAAGPGDRYCVFLDDVAEACPDMVAVETTSVADDLVEIVFSMPPTWSDLADNEWLEIIAREQGGCWPGPTEHTRVVCAAVSGRSLIPFMERLGNRQGPDRFFAFSARAQLATVQVETTHPERGQVWLHTIAGQTDGGPTTVKLTSQRLMILSGTGDDYSTPYRGAIRAAQDRARCLGCASSHYSARG